MTGFAAEHHGAYGVAPICRVPAIALSMYHRYWERVTDPDRRPSHR